ncbi:Ras-like GTP-binding protein YPT1 [Tritrichomonas foetus]|uniref:Ras-like GTP-binding protein YPT1 n=1 Tax=Tritrichomonas foetus TaxID=1144522 RepID=A0A1J4JSB9_9EUKA|nr:Ras-like GTP-binding protein YPT1 [Tritrichomonas foetus]|eukprot:OHT00414.1 Ras-like GTP-binding protein YPT1 [Tritrichomonas foetus]
MQIWDTAGQERFQSITANYYHGSHAIAIVYDITDRASFDHLRKWIDDVDKLANPNVCKFLVGNKADLQTKRCVSTEEGQQFANTLGIPFIETSAKTALNVQKMFKMMCQAIADRQGRDKPQRLSEDNHAFNRIGTRVAGHNECAC